MLSYFVTDFINGCWFMEIIKGAIGTNQRIATFFESCTFLYSQSLGWKKMQIEVMK